MVLGDEGDGKMVGGKERAAAAAEASGLLGDMGPDIGDRPGLSESIGSRKGLLMDGDDAMGDDLVRGVSGVCTGYDLLRVGMRLCSLSPCID